MADDRKYWYGSDPSFCQWCGQATNGAFVDGATSRGWAILCIPCHARRGYGIGLGRGQKYIRMPDSGKWLKDEPEKHVIDPPDLMSKLFS
jgi:hypothetical protein